MKFLLDVSPDKLALLAAKHPEYVGGQLLTPSTKTNAGGVFAIDNGCFGRFEEEKWKRLLERDCEHKANCLWVAAPDVVGSARRTLEVFEQWGPWLYAQGWPVALVAQDGIEDLPIPWAELQAVFIGGTDSFKDSATAKQVAKAARLMGKRVHLGRVNATRFISWQGHVDSCDGEPEADTCDGSGYSRFTDEMFGRLVERVGKVNAPLPLFHQETAVVPPR